MQFDVTSWASLPCAHARGRSNDLIPSIGSEVWLNRLASIMGSLGALALFGVLLCCSGVRVEVSDVSGYTKLRSWKKSTLYRVEADAGYEANPLLLHLVGSRYGELVHTIPILLSLASDWLFQTWDTRMVIY